MDACPTHLDDEPAQDTLKADAAQGAMTVDGPALLATVCPHPAGCAGAACSDQVE